MLLRAEQATTGSLSRDPYLAMKQDLSVSDFSFQSKKRKKISKTMTCWTLQFTFETQLG
jgi:hypothetical protein